MRGRDPDVGFLREPGPSERALAGPDHAPAGGGHDREQSATRMDPGGLVISGTAHRESAGPGHTWTHSNRGVRVAVDPGVRCGGMELDFERSEEHTSELQS